MALPPIRKIGCIHFDQHRIADPIATIKAAVANYGEGVSDALIVLPEALNVGGGYYRSEKVDFVFDISELKAVSCESNVAFVAGLAEQSSSNQKPYNSAFLIDPERVCRLSRKLHPDRDARWYNTWHGHARCINYRGLVVASLICQDATGFGQAASENGEDSYLHKGVLNCLRKTRSSPVLCVPARMTTHFPSCIAGSWPLEINVVVANVCNPKDRASGIRMANCEWEPCLGEICLRSVPSSGAATP